MVRPFSHGSTLVCAINRFIQGSEKTSAPVLCRGARGVPDGEGVLAARGVRGGLLRSLGAPSSLWFTHDSVGTNIECTQAVVVAWQIGDYQQNVETHAGSHSFWEIFKVIIDGALVPLIVRPLISNLPP